MRYLTLCAITSLALLAGCAKESPRGGPGASAPPRETIQTRESRPATVTDTSDSSRTFTVSVPSTKTSIVQGAREEITIGVNRGTHFDQNVNLRLKAPAGIMVEPALTTVSPETKNVHVLVSAAPDAPVGNASIEVTGMPETGQAVAVRLDVDVTRR